MMQGRLSKSPLANLCGLAKLCGLAASVGCLAAERALEVALDTMTRT